MGKAYLDVVQTGGTIDMEGLDARRPVGFTSHLIAAIESFGHDVRVHKVFDPPLDSSNIGSSEWRKLSDLVVHLCAEQSDADRDSGSVPGIVITHGTDTLQDTALVLSLELAQIDLRFPVALTCAFAPHSESNSDAVRNLVLAASVALSFEMSGDGKHLIPPGVYVVVGNDIHVASRIKKVTTRSVNGRSYVESYPAPVGQLKVAHRANLWKLDLGNQVRMQVHRDLLPKRQRQKRTLTPVRDCFGYVEHLWFGKDSPVDLIESAMSRCHKGAINLDKNAALVLQGDFSNKSDDDLFAIARCLHRFRRSEVPIPVFSGSPSVVDKVNGILQRRSLIYLIPKSLSHAKARTKLSWLLRCNLIPNDLAVFLSRDIAGECFDVPVLPDWIAGESYGPNDHRNGHVAKRVILVSPDIRAEVYREAIDSLIDAKAKKRELNIIGFGDGNVPIGAITVAECTAGFLHTRYNIDPAFHGTETYVDVESEIIAYLRYDSTFRTRVIDRYAIEDEADMVREILAWCVRQREIEKRTRLERRAQSLVSSLADDISGNNERVRRVIERVGYELAVLIDPDENRMRDVRSLVTVRDILGDYGFAVEHLRYVTDDDAKNAERVWVNPLLEWLSAHRKDMRQLSLLVKALSPVYARRIMKDAIAQAHEVLGDIVRCVDSGVRVNIKSNAEMARTDTRRYEIGNLLLIAGVDSADARGWPAGPLRQYFRDRSG